MSYPTKMGIFIPSGEQFNYFTGIKVRYEIIFLTSELLKLNPDMKTIQTWLAIISLSLFYLSAAAGEKCKSTSGCLPDYPLPEGVSAPFAGFVGDWLLVAGGCNFPDTPAAQGGTKVYYSQGYALDINAPSPQWIPLPDLPFPVAYGASVETPKGLVCIGGMNADSCLTQVWRITQDNKQEFRIESLPSLPEAIDNASATRIGNRIYVTGGNQLQDKNSLYTLNPETDSVWTRLAAYPGPRRVQPILTAENNTLFLAGGFQAFPESKTCILSTDMLEYDLSTGQWKEGAQLPSEKNGHPRCLAGGTGVSVKGLLILTGGINYNIFRTALEGKSGASYMLHEPEWYQFNDDLLLFDTRKKTWKTLYDIPGMARAGGILLQHNHILYMVCGELKPGIRSPQISTYKLKE